MDDLGGYLAGFWIKTYIDTVEFWVVHWNCREKFNLSPFDTNADFGSDVWRHWDEEENVEGTMLVQQNWLSGMSSCQVSPGKNHGVVVSLRSLGRFNLIRKKCPELINIKCLLLRNCTGWQIRLISNILLTSNLKESIYIIVDLLQF